MVERVVLGYAPEGAKRRYPAHFLAKLTDTDGELQETLHWLDSALACGYLAVAPHSMLVTQSAEVGRKLGSMMAQHESFCTAH